MFRRSCPPSHFSRYQILLVIGCGLSLGACQDPDDSQQTGNTTPAGEAIAGQDSAGALTAGQGPAGEQVAGQTSAGAAIAGQGVAGEVIAGEVTSGVMSAGEAIAGEAIAGESAPGNSPLPPETPVEACAEFGATECFANNECELDARCQDVGAPGFPVSCCVRGARGQGMTGDACSDTDGQLTCASSICVMLEGASEGFCSGECLSESDCPETLPRCIPIAFSGNDSMWCFPPEGS